MSYVVNATTTVFERAKGVSANNTHYFAYVPRISILIHVFGLTKNKRNIKNIYFPRQRNSMRCLFIFNFKTMPLGFK